MMRYEGKTAIVTGGASGIGRAVAHGLAAEGASVVLADIDEGAAAAAVASCDSDTGTVLFQRTDVGRAPEVQALLRFAVTAFGRVDVLVNAAGIAPIHAIVDTPEEVWDRVIATNLKGVFLCSQAAARQMIAQGNGGRIVSISSIHAMLSEPNAGAYSASKGGIEAFSRTLADELAAHHITVNCVRPGATWTGMTLPLYTPQVEESLRARIPQRQIAEPEWIAAGVLYFASDDSRYSTGTTLTIDGGYSMSGALPGTAYSAAES